MARSVRNCFYLLALVGGLTFFSGLVFAQANPLPVPVHISTGAAVPSGLQSTVTFDARGVGTAANAGYYSKPVLVSNNTLGQLGKGLLRRAAPIAAMAAAIEAAGWAIDELTGQVMDGEPQPAPGPVPAGGVYYEYHSKYYSSASAATAAVIARMDYAGAPHTSHRYPGGDFANLKAVCQHHEAWASGDHLSYEYFAEHRNETAFPQPYPWADALPQPSPVPDAAIGQLVANDPALANAALHNADGSVNRNPDVMAAAQALAQQLASPDPLQNPDPVGEWNTGQQAGPQPSGSPVSLEFPAFCSWATGVCDAIAWFQDDQDDEPPPVDVDWIDPEAAVTWSSGLGGGSCPADVSASLPFGGEVTFPMGQFCALADLIRPLILLAAALTAAMIIGGYRSAA